MKDQKVDYSLFLTLASLVLALGLIATFDIVFSDSVVAGELSSRTPQSLGGAAGTQLSSVKNELYKIVKINCVNDRAQQKSVDSKTKFVSLEASWCAMDKLKNLSIKNVTNNLDGVGFVLNKHKLKSDYVLLSPGSNDFEIKFFKKNRPYVYNITIGRKKK